MEPVIQRLLDIERRLSVIEDKLHIANKLNTTPVRADSTIVSTAANAPLLPEANQTIKPNPRSISAGSVLGAIGVICFVVATAFIIEITIVAGWLTPIRQWGLVYILAFALIAAGKAFAKKDNDYAGYAVGAGLIGLYFAAYSGYSVFHVVEAGTSLGLSIFASVVGLWLFQEFRNTFYACTSVIGTFLTPVLLHDESTNLWLISAYFLVWTSVFSWMATTLNTRVTSLLAAYFGIGIYALIHLTEADPLNLEIIVTVQALLFMIIVAGTIRYSVLKKQILTESEAWLFFPVGLFFYSVEYFFLAKWNASIAPWISLGFAAILLSGYFVAQKRLQETSLKSREIVFSFVAIVAFHSGFFELVPDLLHPYLLFVVLSAFYISNRRAGATPPPRALLVLGAVIALIEYWAIFVTILSTDRHDMIIPALLGTLAMFVCYFEIVSVKTKNIAILFLSLIHFMVICTLYRMTSPYGSLAVSMSWLFYSVIVLGLAFQKKDWTFARSAMLVLMISAGKALLYDSAQAPSLVRIGSLLVTGILLYGSGYLFRKIAALENAVSKTALPTR